MPRKPIFDDNAKELTAFDECVDVRIPGVSQAGIHVLHFEPRLAEERTLSTQDFDVAF